MPLDIVIPAWAPIALVIGLLIICIALVVIADITMNGGAFTFMALFLLAILTIFWLASSGWAAITTPGSPVYVLNISMGT